MDAYAPSSSSSSSLVVSAEDRRRPIQWMLTCIAHTIFGSLSLCFALKEFFDPAFSQWVAPGPGNPLFGDGGNMLYFEAGPDGVQSRILGLQASYLEGTLLGVGSISTVTCWFASPHAQLCTALLAPLSASCYVVLAIYFPYVAAAEMVGPMLVLGFPPLLTALYRMHTFHPEREALLPSYYAYLVALSAATSCACLWVQHRIPLFPSEVELLIRVREHFLEENGMRWSAGQLYPNGFVPETRWFGLLF